MCLGVRVSIVSIQADQSRQEKASEDNATFAAMFQSYQFRQINPDIRKLKMKKSNYIVSIVSIQADQSRQGRDNY